MKRALLAALAAPAVSAATLPMTAEASSHREAPLIGHDPSADNTDLYAWMSSDLSKLNVVANWIPLEEPAGGPNFYSFSGGARYEVHIGRGDNLNPKWSYYFYFQMNPRISRIPRVDPATAGVGGGAEFFIQLTGLNPEMRVERYTWATNKTEVIGSALSVAPANIGPRTDAVIRGGTPYDDAFAATFVHDLGAQGRVFAGPRDDGFYVDLGGIFDLANLRAKGVAQDGVAGFNTHAIAMEIPVAKLGAAVSGTPGNLQDVLNVWSATSRRKMSVLSTTSPFKSNSGDWVQTSRLGIPLVNEALVGIQDKDKYNATKPVNDLANFGAYILHPVAVRDAEAVGIYAALSVDPTPFKHDRFDIVNAMNAGFPFTQIGDVLRVDMQSPSGFPNGRPIPGGAQANQEQADVTDVLLSVILAGGALTISDGVDYNDKDFLPDLPWLALPHRGFDEGHGTPTP
ncbi:MAG: DUF4331 domain-containing protein [Deltaproteobacteria bacterium]|nr:DUF4331 domain-containing protein [Deltaproteobacteria bacterium]